MGCQQFADLRHFAFAGRGRVLLSAYADGGPCCLAAAIARMQRCRVIAREGIGVDIVDVEAASVSGIVATNVPGYCIEEVADLLKTLEMGLAGGFIATDLLGVAVIPGKSADELVRS